MSNGPFLNREKVRTTIEERAAESRKKISLGGKTRRIAMWMGNIFYNGVIQKFSRLAANNIR